MSHCENNNPVLFDLYSENKHIVSDRTVFDGIIDMGGLPDSYIGVAVTFNDIPLTEITDDRAPQEGEFKVDYRHGWLYVNPDAYSGKSLKLDFYSRGIELTPSSRIYTFDKNGRIDMNTTLQSYIDVANSTPSFIESDELSNIVSGESFSTIFGKIRKWFTELKKVAFSGSYNDLSDKPMSMRNPNSLTLSLNGSSASYNGASNLSRSWYAPTLVGTAGYELVSNGSGAPIWKAPSYAVCSTAASTAAKTVSINNFKLVVGARIYVKFTYDHTGNSVATLNVSNTGAKNIVISNGDGYVNISNKLSWNANETVELLYNGTYWIAISSDMRLISGSQSASVIIGTINTPGYCDYRCDGTNDTEMFKLAIKKAMQCWSAKNTDIGYTNTAVKIFIKRGFYNITDTLYTGSGNTISYDNYLIMEGECEHAVTLYKDDTTKPLFNHSDIILGFKNINFYHKGVANEELICSGVSYTNCNIKISASTNNGSIHYIKAYNSDNGVVKMRGGSFYMEIPSSAPMPCYSGFESLGVDIQNCNISLKNNVSSELEPSGSDTELNLMYTSGTGTRGSFPKIIKDCNIYCSGNTSIVAGHEVSVLNCEIRLHTGAKISHFPTNSSIVLRNTFANNHVLCSDDSVYMRFAVITGCSFDKEQAYNQSIIGSINLYNDVSSTITGNFFHGHWTLNLGGRNAIVSANMYRGSLMKGATCTGTVTMANNISA